MKRYKPGLTSTQKPWPNLYAKIMGASMIECEDGGYVEHSPMLDAAPEMYAMLKDIAERYPNSRHIYEPISKLLAKARGEW